MQYPNILSTKLLQVWQKFMHSTSLKVGFSFSVMSILMLNAYADTTHFTTLAKVNSVSGMNSSIGKSKNYDDANLNLTVNKVADNDPFNSGILATISNLKKLNACYINDSFRPHAYVSLRGEHITGPDNSYYVFYKPQSLYVGCIPVNTIPDRLSSGIIHPNVNPTLGINIFDRNNPLLKINPINNQESNDPYRSGFVKEFAVGANDKDTYLANFGSSYYWMKGTQYLGKGEDQAVAIQPGLYVYISSAMIDPSFVNSSGAIIMFGVVTNQDWLNRKLYSDLGLEYPVLKQAVSEVKFGEMHSYISGNVLPIYPQLALNIDDPKVISFPENFSYANHDGHSDYNKKLYNLNPVVSQDNELPTNQQTIKYFNPKAFHPLPVTRNYQSIRITLKSLTPNLIGFKVLQKTYIAYGVNKNSVDYRYYDLASQQEVRFIDLFRTRDSYNQFSNYVAHQIAAQVQLHHRVYRKLQTNVVVKKLFGRGLNLSDAQFYISYNSKLVIINPQIVNAYNTVKMYPEYTVKLSEVAPYLKSRYF